MDVPVWSLGKPVADQLGLVRAGVVHDDVDIVLGKEIVLDMVEEPPELDRTVAGEAAPDDGASLHVESGEQRGGSAAGVVVGSSLGLSG